MAVHSIEPENPTLHEQLVRFRRELDCAHNLDPKVSEVLKSHTDIVPETAELSSFNNNYLSRHKDSISHVQSAIRVREIVDPSSRAQNEKDLVQTLQLPNVRIKQAEEGFKTLQGWESSTDVKEKYLEAARAKWPLATVFAKS